MVIIKSYKEIQKYKRWIKYEERIRLDLRNGVKGGICIFTYMDDGLF